MVFLKEVTRLHWVCAYENGSNSARVADVKWHLIVIEKNDLIKICDHVPTSKRAYFIEHYNEVEQLKTLILATCTHHTNRYQGFNLEVVLFNDTLPGIQLGSSTI
jgi:hypothetical protein